MLQKTQTWWRSPVESEINLGEASLVDSHQLQVPLSAHMLIKADTATDI